MMFTFLVTVGFALFLGSVLFAGSRTTLLGRVLSWRPLVSLGMVSYGIYLWHWPVITIVGGNSWRHDSWPLFIGRLALVLTVTLTLAAASWYVLERRAIALKNTPLRRPTKTAAGRAAQEIGPPIDNSIDSVAARSSTL